MNMNNNIKIYLYKNIINNISDINAWQDIKCFDISILSQGEKKKLKQMCSIDVCFPSIYSKREQVYYNKMITPFNLFVKSYLLTNMSYIYLMEQKLKKQDRIRSYKGLFYNSNIKEYIQKEYLIDEPYSVIAAILLFNKMNIDILDQLYDADSTFAIFSEEKKISEEKILDQIVNNCITFSYTGNTINYLKIISTLCKKDIKVCRITGNFEYEFILQIFCTRSEIETLCQTIKQCLNNIVPEKIIEIYYK